MKHAKIAFLFLILVSVGCSSRSKYNKMIEDGLNSSIEFNELFLGITLGMTDTAFREHCFELNQHKLLFQGDKGLSALYKMSELKHPANMNFYPNFYEGRIFQMPVIFDYVAWAPWNKELYSDSLQQDVVRLFKEWYGRGFLEVRHSEKGSAYVKVDGNRQISVFKQGDRFVKALFTDIRIKKLIDEANEEQVRDGTRD